jgi:hypothetical protein
MAGQTTNKRGRTVVIRKISDNWYSLKSSCDGLPTLLWFGYSREEVLQKFRSYIRERDLDNVRYQPKGITL